MGTFGRRLGFFLHTVKQLSRRDLVRELNTAQTSVSDLKDELARITTNDVRDWEDDRTTPSVAIREIVARVLGISVDLLDPDRASADSSPEYFLDIVARFGLKQKQISHFWRIYKSKWAFFGAHTPRDIELLIRTDPELVFPAAQDNLFLDEFRCKDCGHWEPRELSRCPVCDCQD